MPKPTGSYFGEYTGRRLRGRSYQATGEFRPPRQGEFYLSGSLVTAYRAANDLGTAYWIAVETDAPSWEKYPAKEWALALQSLTPGGSEFVTPAECVDHVKKKMGRDWPSIIIRLRARNAELLATLRTYRAKHNTCLAATPQGRCNACVKADSIIDNKED